MSRLSDLVREARERASRSIDPADHQIKNALEAAHAAEADRLTEELEDRPRADTSDLPPWSAASKPGTESHLP
jgi:hypothetical protein